MWEKEMAKSRAANRVVTGQVRLSYANIFKPKEFDDGSSKYSTKIIVPKSDVATVRKLREAQKVAVEMGEQGKFANKKIKRNAKGYPVPGGAWDSIKDGDDSDDEADHGSWTLNVTANRRPGIIDRDFNDIMDGTEIYSGVYARVSLTCAPYNYQGKIGVTFYLDNVQKLKDGEPLGGVSPKAKDDFEDDLEDDEYEDEDDDLV